jgi:hypothetical protein
MGCISAPDIEKPERPIDPSDDLVQSRINLPVKHEVLFHHDAVHTPILLEDRYNVSSGAVERAIGESLL